MNHRLLLASQSTSRARLLMESKIPFSIIGQTANEADWNENLPLDELVKSIALSKMQHVQIPSAIYYKENAFVLTADTMGKDQQNRIHGKPVNKEDAISKLQSLRYGSCTTAFCLEKKIWVRNHWQTEKRIIESVTAQYEFHVPENWIEYYLKEIPYTEVSGAVQVEGFGAQFLKIVSGSYSTILGLPLFELREALQEIGFFNEINKG